MAKIGAGGLACSIIGFVLIILVFVLSVILLPLGILNLGAAATLGIIITIFPFAGLILGIIGLILGIVGAAKDEKKGAGIVGIVFGAIDIAITLFLFLGVASLFSLI
jgi:hypothetical protein